MSLSPIVLFVYNRPEHTKQTLEALADNSLAKESILYIFADGPKANCSPEEFDKIKQTRFILREKQWCKEVFIIESEKNKGLADSIIDGVTEIINKHEKIIVLEDDIVTSSGFLQYMNDALNIYSDEKKVMHISSYLPETSGQKNLPETFFLRFMSCWGWATWKDRWQFFIADIDYLYSKTQSLNDINKLRYKGRYSPCLLEQLEANYSKKMKTWAIKWFLSIFINKGLCLQPGRSLVRNLGFDGSGINCGTTDIYSVEPANSIEVIRIKKIKESKMGAAYLRRFYKYGKNSSLKMKIYTNCPSIYAFLKRIYRYILKK